MSDNAGETTEQGRSEQKLTAEQKQVILKATELVARAIMTGDIDRTVLVQGIEIPGIPVGEDIKPATFSLTLTISDPGLKAKVDAMFAEHPGIWGADIRI